MSGIDFESEEDREKLEKDILAMLATLEPVPIKMYETMDGYHWTCGITIGNSPPNFVTALKEALEAAAEEAQRSWRRYGLPPKEQL